MSVINALKRPDRSKQSHCLQFANMNYFHPCVIIRHLKNLNLYSSKLLLSSPHVMPLGEALNGILSYLCSKQMTPYRELRPTAISEADRNRIELAACFVCVLTQEGHRLGSQDAQATEVAKNTSSFCAQLWCGSSRNVESCTPWDRNKVG